MSAPLSPGQIAARPAPAEAVTTGNIMPGEAPASRLSAIDLARGLALLAMAAYHALWDLGFLRLTPANHALSGPGRVAAHLIAGSFLALVGIGLVLANGAGIRWRASLLRLARIGGAALLITAATWIAFPDSYIFFGILHCIALSSLLALPFLRAPWWLTAACATLAIAAPSLAAAWAPGGSILDAPALLFLGLGREMPRTNDYVPLFPWFGMVLAGLALARAGVPALRLSPLGLWRPTTRPARAFSFAGRHSLAIYLVHQPILLGLLGGLAFLTGPHPQAGVAEFRRDYLANCTRSGGSEGACRVAARCTVAALRRERLWTAEGAGFSTAQRLRAQRLSGLCYEAAEGTSPPP